MTFLLDPALKHDTQPILRLPLCEVRLMQDSRYVWLILVPQKDGLVDWHDLSRRDAEQASVEMHLATQVLCDLYKPVKTNVAALGNMVKQLHIHVIARHEKDPAWPGPVWGAGTAEPYAPDIIEQRISELTDAFSKHLTQRPT